MKIKSGHLILAISWTAMGSFCFWCDPGRPLPGSPPTMVMTSIWIFISLLAMVIYAVDQIESKDGGKILLDFSPQPKLTGPQTGKGHLTAMEEK